MKRVKEKLGMDAVSYGEHYVYFLLDPRHSPMRVFYIGEGKHERMYDHEKETRRLLKRGRGHGMAWHHKHKVILEIFDSGAIDPSCKADCIPTQIVFRGTEAEALRVERQLIEEYGLERLTNEVYGYSDDAIARLIRKQQRRYQ